jgi:O-antigen biosynthesis protein
MQGLKSGADINLRFEGANDLVCTGESAVRRRWKATGSDPQFRCIFPRGISSIPAGWYWFEIDIAGTSRKLMSPALYPDYGNGDSEYHALSLPFVGEGGAAGKGVVRFTHDVEHLRFDPSAAPGEFEIGVGSLRRLSRMEAAWRMLQFRLANAESRPQVITHAVSQLLGSGPSGLATWLYDGISPQRVSATAFDYSRWLRLYDRKESDAIPPLDGPPLSVIIPVYNTEERWLRKCIDSVLSQSYENWELCIADDASTAGHVRTVLEEYAGSDHRIKVTYRQENGHISASSNTAIASATGEWLVLLDHDDELHPAALAEVARAAIANPDWRLIYSDEDKIDDYGNRFDPYFKPDWNYDLLLGHNCVSHLGVYRRDLVMEVGTFRTGFEGSQDWDLALRCVERLQPSQIGHIPRVLYHWRAIEGSTALAPGEKSYAHRAGLKAIQSHLDRVGAPGAVEEIEGFAGSYRVRYRVPQPEPLVSLIVPTRNRGDLLQQCVDSVLEKTAYRNYEIVIVDNGSTETNALRYIEKASRSGTVRVIRHDAPFNYSEINNLAVKTCNGPLVGLLNNDVEVITEDWLSEMVSHALRPNVGAVGAMLYYPDDTIQHAGILLGCYGVGVNAYAGKPRGWPGQMLRARLIQNMSAVTAACLVVRREAYNEVGGFDETLAVAYNDVDFCLRLREKGYRNVWTPFAELYHHESATRGAEDTDEKRVRFQREVDIMKARWGNVLLFDPAYNPNLALRGENFSLADPPRHQSLST